jgi:putative transcriptional regulator
MINSKRYFLLFLLAFILCGCTKTGSILYDASARQAKPADYRANHQADHPAFLSPPTFRSFVSLERRQLNGRLSKGKFLVASRNIRDPRFMETVILLVQHDLHGTAGLIVNRPTTARLSDFFPEIKEQHGEEHFTYIGGPVGITQISLLIRQPNKPEESQWIFDDIYVSASKTVFERLIKKPDGKAKFRAYAGYAGWSYGQLEQEVFRGDWQVVQADAETIFNKSASKIWPDLIRTTEIIRIEL